MCFLNLGSSPLARGLPADDGCADGEGRIIPARAGFTTPPPGSFVAEEDHPRSRGVYEGITHDWWELEGSSPLARGLPTPSRPATPAAGIIPARAGFTQALHPREASRRDHPRSRGVYRGRTRVTSIPRGSSPLARGLPSRGGPQWTRRRIIPARAGFTGAAPPTAAGAGDHPRSRGVYGRRPRYHGGGPDHPRSRGVYLQMSNRALTQAGSSPLARGLPRTCFSSPELTGSSPLARGLLHARSEPRNNYRIIPARAGFTLPVRPDYCHPRDHPRSRGVYYHEIAHETVDQGSSPLARGLPARADYHVDDAGIIPARAGFTPPPG